MKNRFENMSAGKQAILLAVISIGLLLVIELSLRGVMKLLEIPRGEVRETPPSNLRPLLGYFNEPRRPSVQYEAGHPYFTEQYNTLPATDRYGFTLDSDDNPDRDLLTKGACEYRIFVFGGSTVEGTFLASVDDTIPARLEKAIRQWPEASGIDLTVINAGEGGFFSQQEVVFERFIVSYVMKPDHVIFFNGSNDFHSWPENQPEAFSNIDPHHHLIYRKVHHEKKLARSIDGLIRNLTYHSAVVDRLYKFATNIRQTIADYSSSGGTATATSPNPPDGAASNDMDDWVDKHVHRYLKNMSTALSAARPGHAVTTVLQPTMLPETIKSIEEVKISENLSKERSWHKQFNYLAAKQKFYGKLREALPTLSAENGETDHALVVDLSDAFEAKKAKQTWFGDHVHYLPAGRDVIVDKLLARIRGQLLNGLAKLRANGCT